MSAAASYSQAQLDDYLINTVATGLPAREFWNPRQTDVYAALVAKLNDKHVELEAAKTELGTRVANHVTNVLYEAQAKAHLAAA
jgi:hypothetical protein